ncbi:hypothetical protein LINPERPRIM_LOCUS13726 [Linum perenne]
MKRSKYMAPGNLRRDAKKPRSFRMLCFDSNPTTKQNISQNESSRVDMSSSRLDHTKVVEDILPSKQTMFSKNATETPTRKEATDTSQSTREHPLSTKDATSFAGPRSPLRTSSEDYVENMENIDEDPMHQDGLEATKKRIGRGMNKCNEITKLKKDEKLPVEFIDGRGAGHKGAVFSSQLGVIIRDPNIMPVRVLNWKCLTESELDHLWAAAQEHFECDNMQDHRASVLNHMNEIWNRWRSRLKSLYLTDIRTEEEALENTPPMMDNEDWAWLVRKVYFTKEYEKKSGINKQNRTNKKLIHHIGSKSTRQIKYEYKKEHGVFPSLEVLFELKFQEGGEVKHPVARKKLDEIREAYESNPDATEYEVVEKVFGAQTHGKAAILGGGVKVKDIRDNKSRKNAELNARLQESEAGKAALQKRLEDADIARGKEMDELRAANDKTVKEMEALKAMMFRLCQTGIHQSQNATSDV